MRIVFMHRKYIACAPSTVYYPMNKHNQIASLGPTLTVAQLVKQHGRTSPDQDKKADMN